MSLGCSSSAAMSGLRTQIRCDTKSTMNPSIVLDAAADSQELVPYEAVESMTPEARLRTYAILKELEKRVSARLEELKPLLR